MTTRTIAVVGATGAQGGGLVRAILADGSGAWRARALTRKPDSPAARALAAAGAEVVAADLDDRGSLERAFAGAHGVFGVTNFWEHVSPEREFAQAEHIALAARTAGAAHVVWSTLEDSRRFIPLDDARMPTLLGRYKVPHFDAKGEADACFREAGVPTTHLLTSFYWENLIHFGMGLKPGADGVLEFVLPMADRKLPGIAVEDIGKCTFGLFREGEPWVGRTVGIAGEHLSGAEMASALGRALGREVRHVHVPWAAYRGFGFPGAEDIGNMFQFNHDFADVFRAARDVELSRRLNPALQRFDQWLSANLNRIPIG